MRPLIRTLARPAPCASLRAAAPHVRRQQLAVAPAARGQWGQFRPLRALRLYSSEAPPKRPEEPANAAADAAAKSEAADADVPGKFEAEDADVPRKFEPETAPAPRADAGAPAHRPLPTPPRESMFKNLPSQLERRRSEASRLFSKTLDELQTAVFSAGQKLNILTGYSDIEALKRSIETLGTRRRPAPRRRRR